MTPISFRVDDRLLIELDRVAAEAGSSRSAVLNQALSELLYRLACERDAAAYDRVPLIDEELIPPEYQSWPDGGDAAW
ncbi:MAG: ribbon-helix-helix domain-containing protein [Acidimicrobiia bacterium]|nr:ribbon-helix-helix domain-containing protein [Acidimicrobiia bacterium]